VFTEQLSSNVKGEGAGVRAHTHTHTHRQLGEPVSLILFFQNKENRLKMSYVINT
jgi:hypothetical protein